MRFVLERESLTTSQAANLHPPSPPEQAGPYIKRLNHLEQGKNAQNRGSLASPPDLPARTIPAVAPPAKFADVRDVGARHSGHQGLSVRQFQSHTKNGPIVTRGCAKSARVVKEH